MVIERVWMIVLGISKEIYKAKNWILFYYTT